MGGIDGVEQALGGVELWLLRGLYRKEQEPENGPLVGAGHYAEGFALMLLSLRSQGGLGGSLEKIT